jgi:hypothetical protein
MVAFRFLVCFKIVSSDQALNWKKGPPVGGKSGPPRTEERPGTGNGGSLFPGPGRIGKRGLPPRFPAKSGIGGTGFPGLRGC